MSKETVCNYCGEIIPYWMIEMRGNHEDQVHAAAILVRSNPDVLCPLKVHVPITIHACQPCYDKLSGRA